MAAFTETKEQFVERYSKGSATQGVFDNHRIAMPCDCEDGGGPTHWAAIRRDTENVEHHLQFHAPEGTPWPTEIDKATANIEADDE